MKNKETSGITTHQVTQTISTGHIGFVDEPSWRSIVEQSTDGIILINKNEHIEFANPAAAQLYNKPFVEIIGHHCGFIPASNSSIIFNPNISSNTTNLVEARTTNVQWGKEKVILATLRALPIFQRNEESGIEFTCRLTLDGRILETNKSFSQYLDQVGFDLSKRKIFDLFSIQDRLNFELEIEALLGNSTIGFFQTTLIDKNEAAIQIYWELQPEYDHSGQIIEIIATGHEQTRLSQLSSILNVSQTIIDNATDGILLTDHQGRIVSINKSFSSIFGYRLKEVIGRPLRILFSSVYSEEFYNSIKQQVKAAGFWQGEYFNQRKSDEVFPSWLTIHSLKDSNGKTTNTVFYIRDITEKKKIEKSLESKSTRDALTDLPNRAQFFERLTQALSRAKRTSERVAILYLDLDRFKMINDNFGHDIGDQLLIQVSERLNSIRRESDTLARMGGDEFVIMLLGPSVDPIPVAQKILSMFNSPYKVGDHEFYITCSIGISFFPEDGDDVSTLMKNSDLAMYQAKEKGRNYFEFFSPEMNEKAHRQMDMGADLRLAIVRDEFSLDYQPIVDANTGRVIAMEALIRWEHPTLGRVFPDTFIPLAESTGLIVEIGTWVLRKACKEGRKLQDSGWNEISISVNISGYQLEREMLVIAVREALDESGLPPHSLDLEITESLITKKIERTRKILQELRSIGVKISIDDFGTGYSSLNSLMIFRVNTINTIKIDKSFIMELTKDPQNLTLVQGIIQIGHNLNLKVIAEGVETAEQAGLLRDNFVDALQGYHFSTPLSLKKLMTRLNETNGFLGQM